MALFETTVELFTFSGEAEAGHFCAVIGTYRVNLSPWITTHA